MKSRFILYRRKRGGMFYVEDTQTRKQESLGTRDHAEATAMFSLQQRSDSARLERVHPVDEPTAADTQLFGNLVGGELPAGDHSRCQQSLLASWHPDKPSTLRPRLAPDQAGSGGIASTCPCLPASHK